MQKSLTMYKNYINTILIKSNLVYILDKENIEDLYKNIHFSLFFKFCIYNILPLLSLKL